MRRLQRTSLTLHSPQKGTQVLSLEKRNHPKTGEAMLVLNGQNFTTTTIRPHCCAPVPGLEVGTIDPRR